MMSEYAQNSDKDLPIVAQIDHMQNSFNRIQSNERHSNDLGENVKAILLQVNAAKEQEILDFINKIRQSRFNDSKDKIGKLSANLAALDKRWKEVNDENDDFIGTLTKAQGTSKNKDKLNLIGQLLRESDGSKKDLNKMKGEAGNYYLNVFIEINLS